jgi:hypothetical protein
MGLIEIKKPQCLEAKTPKHWAYKTRKFDRIETVNYCIVNVAGKRLKANRSF